MSKKKKEMRRKKNPLMLAVLAVLAALVLAVLVLFIMPQVLYYMNPEDAAEETVLSETAQTEADAPETTIPAGIAFPVALADGKLELESLFQFTGINPDSGNADCTDAASVQLKNSSGEYLSRAEISVTLYDGTVLTFTVTDLPAGASVLAFSPENLELTADAVCMEASCDANFEDAPAEERISAAVDGMTVTLTNHTGEDLKNIVVYCRSPYGEDYFGGIAYQYTVENLPAYGNATVEALDCILGIAEVVRIACE